MFEQLGNVALNSLQLVELQIRIGNSEQVPGFGLFVNENSVSLANKLFFYFKKPFALEHDREDVTGRNVMRIIQFDDLAQKRFSGFLGLIVFCASLCADWRSSCF